jgi:ribosomal protein L29
MKDIREKSVADLTQFVSEKRAEIQKIRFGTAGSGTRNTRAQRNARREVARALTELNARTRAKGA